MWERQGTSHVCVGGDLSCMCKGSLSCVGGDLSCMCKGSLSCMCRRGPLVYV